MKEAYLKYYERYRPIAPVRFFLDSLFAPNKRRKLALLYRQKDYFDLSKQPQLFSLHRTLNHILWKGHLEWKSYDYGEGYFYQSFRRIGIRGFRNTEGRVEAMNLPALLAGKHVLEIGCNAGFLSLSLAGDCASITAFDIAPHWIAVAREVAQYLAIRNADFHICSFETLGIDRKFDVVLSFANHSTYDGNTKQPLQSYFEKCASLVNPNGLFLFESHPPEHEGDGLEKVCDLIGEHFQIHRRETLHYGSFLDQNRTFIIAKDKFDATL